MDAWERVHFWQLAELVEGEVASGEEGERVDGFQPMSIGQVHTVETVDAGEEVHVLVSCMGCGGLWCLCAWT